MASKQRIDRIKKPAKPKPKKDYLVGFRGEDSLRVITAKSHKAAAVQAAQARVGWAMVSDLPITHYLHVRLPSQSQWRHFTINHELKSK